MTRRRVSCDVDDDNDVNDVEMDADDGEMDADNYLEVSELR